MTATTRVLAATATLLIVLPFAASTPEAQEGGVTFERLMNAADEPHNWLTYSGNYKAQRHTTLDQITPGNVDQLELQWVFQARSLQVFQTTPLVVDGMMYLTEAPNTVYAVDAEQGQVFWRYEYTPSRDSRPCCGRVNRGLAILGDTLFMGTIDAQLIAIDAVSGQPIWQTSVESPSAGYALTLAPLIVKDKVIVSVAGGEYGIRGFISAYDVETGEEVWKFYTIPGPGEPGHETWGDDSWRYGGASGVDHRLVRSGCRPDLLGHRQPGTRLEPGPAAGRQPLLRLGGRARPGYGGAGLVLPVHAERSV